MKQKRKKRKRVYTKTCRALLTPDMWIDLQEMKAALGKSKSAIIREALDMYKKASL